MALKDVDLKYVGGVPTVANLAVTSGLTVAGSAVTGSTVVTDPNTTLPSDHNLTAWSYDPAFSSTGQLLTNGTLYLSAVPIRKAATISKLWYLTTTAGATPTTGQNWMGLYTSTGTLVASVGIDGSVTSASVAVGATLGTPYAAAAGKYWVAILVNAATAPTLLRTSGSTTGTNNANLSGTTLRFATNATTQTTLPGTITTSSNAAGPSIWVAAS